MKKISINNTKVVTWLRVLYPLWMMVGMFSLMYVPSALIDMSDGAKTLDLISNNILLYRFGIMGSIATQLLYIIIPIFLYHLFSSISSTQSILMVAFAWVSIPMTMYNELKKMEIIELLDQPERAMEIMEMYYQGINLSSMFWGLWLFPLGILAIRSNFFPKIIGYFLLLGGTGYFLGAVLEIVYPHDSWFTSLLGYLTIGEVIFILWLLLAGIRTKPESNA